MGTIGERFRQIIEKLEMNPNSFATALNMRSTAIYNIINGKNKPSYDLMEDIVEKFKVSSAWLLTGTGEMMQVDCEKDTFLDEDIISTNMLSITNGTHINNSMYKKMLRALPDRELSMVAFSPFSRIIHLYSIYDELWKLIRFFKMPETFLCKFPKMEKEVFFNEMRIKFPQSDRIENRREVDIERFLYMQEHVRLMEIEIDNIILSISLERDLINVGRNID